MERYVWAVVLIVVLGCGAVFAQSGWKMNRKGGGDDLVTVYFTSSERGFIAGDNGYLASTEDGGRTWTKRNIGATNTINEIFFRNEDNGYLVAGRQMFRTRDGGRNWEEIRIYRPGEFRIGSPEFLSIRFADRKRGIVIGSLLNRQGNVVDSLVMRTDDGGESWQRIVVPSKKELYHLDFVGDSRCWIVGDDGLILHSTDGGVTFRAQRSGTALDLYNVDFRDEREGYVVGRRGTILRTENGGTNWETVRTEFPMTLMRVDFADDKNGVIVGYDGAILRSSDKGRTWTRLPSDGFQGHLYGLFFVRRYGWAVGAGGAVLRYER